MAWERLKRIFRRQSPKIKWVEASDNPWGVRVLDVRPITQTRQLASNDRQCAVNAVSFGQDDGTSFIGEEPPVTRTVEANLRYPVDRILADGVLFTPRVMEHLWALFFHRDEIICVDSWTRKVRVIARVQGLSIGMTGVAMEDGARGDTVRVRNPASRRIVHAEVIAAGVVRINLSSVGG